MWGGDCTFCLVRGPSNGHDNWALRNLWGTFPESPVILIGSPHKIFTDIDRNYHKVEWTGTIKGAIDHYRKSPTPLLIFLRSVIIVTELEITKVITKEELRKGTPLTFGDWTDGFFGIFRCGLLPLPHIGFFEESIPDDAYLSRLCKGVAHTTTLPLPTIINYPFIQPNTDILEPEYTRIK